MTLPGLTALAEFPGLPTRRFKAKDGTVHAVRMDSLHDNHQRGWYHHWPKAYSSPCGKVRCKSPKRVRGGRTNEPINCIACAAEG